MISIMNVLKSFAMACTHEILNRDDTSVCHVLLILNFTQYDDKFRK